MIVMLKKGLSIEVPCNYFPDDDPSRISMVRWKGHANLLFSNWLNYYVYQATPFNIGQIPGQGTSTDIYA
jgi:homoserine O-succinyltransferase